MLSWFIMGFLGSALLLEETLFYRKNRDKPNFTLTQIHLLMLSVFLGYITIVIVFFIKLGYGTDEFKRIFGEKW